MNIKRLTKEQFIERVKDLYSKFYNHLEGVSFEEFYNEALSEYNKQQQMADEELNKYRLKSYYEIIGEANKLSTDEERKKLEEEDMKILNQQDFLENGRN